MSIDLSVLNYNFLKKPLLVGGMAKEYYGIRKSGEDIDLIISAEDYENLSKQYPDKLRDLWGDLGVAVHNFEIWKTIALCDYEFLSSNAIELDNILVIRLDKLIFMTALAMEKPKYMEDLTLTVKKFFEIQYKDFDDTKYKKHD